MDKIKLGYPKGTEIKVQEIAITYWQEDCHSDNTQQIKINTCSLGGDFFYEIETEKWSFDEIDDLINLLNDFKSRIE